MMQLMTDWKKSEEQSRILQPFAIALQVGLAT